MVYVVEKKGFCVVIALDLLGELAQPDNAGSVWNLYQRQKDVREHNQLVDKNNELTRDLWSLYEENKKLRATVARKDAFLAKEIQTSSNNSAIIHGTRAEREALRDALRQLAPNHPLLVTNGQGVSSDGQIIPYTPAMDIYDAAYLAKFNELCPGEQRPEGCRRKRTSRTR